MDPTSDGAAAGCVVCGGHESRLRFVKLGRRFLECRECGFVSVDPLPDAESLRAYYTEHYADGRYTPFAEATDIRRRIAEHRFERVRSAARAGRWLDVGCSTGDFVAAAARGGMEAEGVDVSPGAVEQARERGLVAHCARVEEFEPECAYDAITAFDLIEHVLDPRATIRQLRGWLAPGGALVITVPDVSSIYPRLLMGRHWFYYWPDEHFWYFDPRTIRRLFEEEGFAVSGVTPARKPMTLTYATKNLEAFNGTLGRIAQALVRPLPDSLTSRSFPFYFGEMLVVAHRRDEASAEPAAGRSDAPA